MDGIAALRSVLVADAALIALVPASRVVAGPLPLGSALDAISLQSISKTDLNIPSRANVRQVTERVQATILAKNFPTQKAIMRAIRKAAADKLYPTVNGISGVTIHTDSAGPDFMNDDATIHLGSQDFRVIYNEPT